MNFQCMFFKILYGSFGVSCYITSQHGLCVRVQATVVLRMIDKVKDVTATDVGEYSTKLLSCLTNQAMHRPGEKKICKNIFGPKISKIDTKSQ